MEKCEIQSNKDFLQKHIIDDLNTIVENYPYHAFCIMGITIELFGKLISPTHDLNTKDTSEEDFNYAINNISAFADYKTLPLNLYTSLRCSLAHTMLPGKDIQLLPDGDKLSCRQFGAKQMYERIVKAWGEVIVNAEAIKKLNKKAAATSPKLTGGTESNAFKQVCKGKA